MHKGVIILVKATSRAQAIKAAKEFLEPYGNDRVWGWYKIGGGWTGMLTGYNPEKDPRNYEKCPQCGGTGFQRDADGKEWRAKDASYTCNGCGTYDRTKKAWTHGPLGPGRRVKSEWAPVDDDVMPLSDKRVRKVVQERAEGWKEEILPWINDSIRRRGKDDLIMGYLLKQKGAVLADDFCLDSSVYDVERETNTLPRSFAGYWAVMVDMHN